MKPSLVQTEAGAHRIRMSHAIWSQLRAYHLAAKKRAESISVVLGHAHWSENGVLTIILGRPEGLLLFSDDCYERRDFAAAVLKREVRAQVLLRAVQEGWTAVVDVHDHHFAREAGFSAVDDRDDWATATYFTRTLPRYAQEPPVAAALLLAQNDVAARFVTGRTALPWGTDLRVDVVGLEGLTTPGLRVPLKAHASAGRTRRHSGVVPSVVQSRLAGLEVAVVGVGGTGSILSEALARLGVGRITLIDADSVEESNLNRLQGCNLADIGRPKAEVLAERLRTMLPSLQVRAVVSDAHEAEGASALAAADVIFGCVDNPETRWWLNRQSVHYLQPYFDVGVEVELAPTLTLKQRVNVIIPGSGPCGCCSPIEFMPTQRPASFLDAEAIRVQRAAGYIKDVPAAEQGDPSLYSLNLQAVGRTVQEFTAWASGRDVTHGSALLMPQGVAHDISLRRFGGAAPVDCPVCSSLLGVGDSVALPESRAEVSGTADGVAQALAATFHALAANGADGDIAV